MVPSTVDQGDNLMKLRALAASTVLTAGSLTALTAVAAAPAQARCSSNGSHDIALYYNTVLVAEEDYQYSSTCDGDSFYAGKILDAKTDGHCASALFFDPSQTTQGVECTTGAWANYSYTDPQHNSSAQIEITVDYFSSPKYAITN